MLTKLFNTPKQYELWDFRVHSYVLERDIYHDIYLNRWVGVTVSGQWRYLSLNDLDTIKHERIKFINMQPEPLKEGQMNYTKAILIVDDNVKVVKVNYDSNNNDKYFKTLLMDLAKDDLVVIPTATRHNMTVGKIVETDCLINLDDNDQISWVIQKVDKDSYENTLKQENVAIEQIKSAELRKKKSDLLDAIKVDQAVIAKMLPPPPAPTATAA